MLAAGVAPAIVHAQANIRWRLASSFPKSLDTIFGAAEVFAKKVGDMTGGKFQITVHAAGELVPAFGVVDARAERHRRDGATPRRTTSSARTTTFALGCAIPFGLNSRQMTAWMYEGNGLKLMREFYAKYNIINFPMGNTGAQMGGWYRKEIKSLADLKGLKLRIGGFGGKVLERIGVVPQNIPGGEIYQALEKGTIDAAEWVGPYDDQKLGFYKVAPNYYYPGWWEGGPQLDLYVNSKAYEGLSAEYKAIIESAAAYAHVEMQAKLRRPQPGGAEAAGGRRRQAVPLPEGRDGRGLQGSDGAVRRAERQNPAWKKIYDDYSNFRRDANLWFRFTEAALRRLHAVAEALSRLAQPAQKKAPPRRGFFVCGGADSAPCAGQLRYFFLASFIDSSRPFIGSSFVGVRRRCRRGAAALGARGARHRSARASARAARSRICSCSQRLVGVDGHGLLDAAGDQRREGDHRGHHDELQDDEGDRALVDLRRRHRRDASRR